MSHRIPAVIIGIGYVVLTATLSSQTPPVPAGQAPAGLAGRPGPASPATYVGSATCGRCHQAIYQRWSKTRMANVVTDPREHPEVVIPDFSKADPLLTFKLDDVAFVYGSKWKQRYFTKV